MDFSRVSALYRWLEYLVFANALQKRRRAFLTDVMGSQNVLVLGDGDGRFTAKFLRAQQLAPEITAHLEYVDCSAGMMRLAERRIRKSRLAASKVQFRLADARSTAFPGPYDLVVSHFFLDCFSTDELSGMIPCIAAATYPNAKWLISEFAIPPAGLWRQFGRTLIRAMYFFFRLPAGLKQIELPDYQCALIASGFRLA